MEGSTESSTGGSMEVNAPRIDPQTRSPEPDRTVHDQPVLDVYIDYKSPYAYLALEPTRNLARAYGLILNWLPYTLDIPLFLGSATLDAHGRLVESSRNAHQWRRVRYAYRDCRREATRRGIVLRGTRKIWDTRPAHIALDFLQRARRQTEAEASAGTTPAGTTTIGTTPIDVERFHDLLFVPFWRRELDIEDPAVLKRCLAAAGVDPRPFDAYLHGEGAEKRQKDQQQAEAKGVFGVPSFVFEGELYWGQERLERLAEQVAAWRARQLRSLHRRGG